MAAMVKDKNGEEQDSHNNARVAGNQPGRINLFTYNFLQFGRGNDQQVHYRVHRFKSVVGEKKIPGQVLVLHEPQKQVETYDTVKKDQYAGCCAMIEGPQKRDRLTIGRDRQYKEEQIEPAEQSHSQRPPHFVLVMNVAIFHAGPALRYFLALLTFGFAHIADGNTNKDDYQYKSAKNPVCRTETEHFQLLLNASAASSIRPIS